MELRAIAMKGYWSLTIRWSFMLYPGYSLGEVLPSAEMKSACSTTPANWTEFFFIILFKRQTMKSYKEGTCDTKPSTCWDGFSSGRHTYFYFLYVTASYVYHPIDIRWRFSFIMTYFSLFRLYMSVFGFFSLIYFLKWCTFSIFKIFSFLLIFSFFFHFYELVSLISVFSC